MVELALRLVFSLAVVVGLLLLLAKFSSRRFGAGSGAVIKVHARQPLTRTASVAVVSVGDRVLVLGATEQRVELLTELAADALPAPAETSSAGAGDVEAGEDMQTDSAAGLLEPAATAAGLLLSRPSRRPVAGASTDQSAAGALAGSVLSPATWKQAASAVRGKAPTP